MISTIPVEKKKVDEKKNYVTHTLEIDRISSPLSYRVYKHMNEVGVDWDQIIGSNDFFQSRPFLSALEAFPPKGMEFRYVVFYMKEQAIGLSYYQLFNFKADQSLNEAKGEEGELCHFGKINQNFRSFIAKKINFRSIISGNIILTGEHGFYFSNNTLDKNLQFEVVSKTMENIRLEESKQGETVKVSLIKDFFEDKLPSAQPYFSSTPYHEFSVQPNMILDIDPTWKSFDDYLQAMSSKYRVRAKRAFKKAKGIEKRNLSLEEIYALEDQMYALYQEVAGNAGFNTFLLHKKYLGALKAKSPNDLQITGYFLEGQLVGFYTTIENGKALDAHFIGFKSSVNRSHHIYINMLYDMIRYGITLGKSHLLFARTAMEIKSSVGARPHDMYGYMKHKNTFSNHFLFKVFQYLETKEEWVQRHPFKEEVTKA